jgi:hypothetical protein
MGGDEVGELPYEEGVPAAAAFHLRRPSLRNVVAGDETNELGHLLLIEPGEAQGLGGPGQLDQHPRL